MSFGSHTIKETDLDTAVSITGYAKEIIIRSVTRRRKEANRKSRLSGSKARLYSDEILRLFNAAEWRCVYCNVMCTCGRVDKTEQGGQMSIDHIFPLSDQYPNAIENIVPACSQCNSLKTNKPLKLWLSEIGMSYKLFFKKRNQYLSSALDMDNASVVMSRRKVWHNHLSKLSRRIKRISNRKSMRQAQDAVSMRRAPETLNEDERLKQREKTKQSHEVRRSRRLKRRLQEQEQPQST